VQALAEPVLAHRVIPTGETQVARRTCADVIHDLVGQVPIPSAAR
jgi:MoxR-like ATPase